MIALSGCGHCHHQSLDLVPNSQQEPVRKHLSHQDCAEVGHLYSFKDEALGPLELGSRSSRYRWGCGGTFCHHCTEELFFSA